MDEFKSIIDLVGSITIDDLKYVDYYVCEDFGIFMPVVGYCNYAINKDHTHPAYSFVMYFNPSDSVFLCNINVPETEYLMQGMSPEFAHDESSDNGFTRYIAIFISKELFEEEYEALYK